MTGMDAPAPRIRRAATVSWTLAGVGIAGVVGSSLLAWADTVEAKTQYAQPESAQQPAAPVLPAPEMTTSTSVSPSYSPRAHTRSRGS